MRGYRLRPCRAGKIPSAILQKPCIEQLLKNPELNLCIGQRGQGQMEIPVFNQLFI